jgi:hypothetical protein
MSSQKNDYELAADMRRSAKATGAPINDDSIISIERGRDGEPKTSAVKTVFRPSVPKSKPIGSYWVYIWVIVIAIVVIAWVFLYAYFSSHQAPYSAPIQRLN